MRISESGVTTTNPDAQQGPGPVYFEIVSTPGGYRAQIRGADHELLFWSEAYVSKAAARSAVELVQAGAGSAPVRDPSTRDLPRPDR